MTDGFNTWVSNRESANDQQEKVCNDIKNNNIIVFSVTFQTDITVAPLLQGCASADGGYYEATDGRALAAAYKDIGVRLLNLRLAEKTRIRVITSWRLLKSGSGTSAYQIETEL